MKDENSTTSPQTGDILIARPRMQENLFSRTLVYLQSFSKEGALGFILNRPLGRTLQQEAASELSTAVGEDIPVFFGGPVQSRHMILTRFQPTGTHGFRFVFPEEPGFPEIQPESGPGVIRAFMGYAGWTAGQLEQEIQQNDWIWTASDRIYLGQIFGDSPWEQAVSGDQRWQSFRNYLPAHPETN